MFSNFYIEEITSIYMTVTIDLDIYTLNWFLYNVTTTFHIYVIGEITVIFITARIDLDIYIANWLFYNVFITLHNYVIIITALIEMVDRFCWLSAFIIEKLIM